MRDRIKTEKFCPLIPKSLCVKGVKMPSLSVTPDFIINSTHIVKGKSEGIIILPQMRIPFKAPSLQMDGFNIISIANIKMPHSAIVFFSLLTKNIFIT